MTPGQLPAAWRTLAAELEPYAPAAAVAYRVAASALEASMNEEAEALLTLSEAAAESGYSPRRLRELIAEGVVPQSGRKHAPRIRRGDLPMRPGGPKSPSTSRYDPESDAAAIASRM